MKFNPLVPLSIAIAVSVLASCSSTSGPDDTETDNGDALNEIVYNTFLVPPAGGIPTGNVIHTDDEGSFHDTLAVEGLAVGRVGTRLLLSSPESLFLYDVKTGERTDIPVPDDGYFIPGVAPDFSFLVYSVEDVPGIYTLNIMDINTEEVIATDHEIRRESLILISPDSDEIAFFNGSGDQLVSVKPDGTGYRVIADVDGIASNDNGNAPVWSPDGEWIAYQTRDLELYIVPAAGGDPELIGGGVQANFSNDGELLGYTNVQTGALDIVQLDSRETLHKLRPVDTLGSIHPTFSPDDSQVVYSVGRFGDNESGNLYVTDLATGSTRVIGTDVWMFWRSFWL